MKKIFSLMIMLFALSFKTWAQPFQSTAVTQNGFQLELSAMNPVGVGGVMTGSLKTGLTYSYLIKYVIPSGTTTPVVVTLNVPIGVRLYPQSNNQPALSGGVSATSLITYATTTTPNEVKVTITPPSPNPNGTSETMQVYAWMPPNSTCNGTSFSSTCSLANTSTNTQMTTGNVNVTAEAVSDWCIKEYLAQSHYPLYAIAQGGTAHYVHNVFRNTQHPEQDTIGKMSIKRLDLKSTAQPNAIIVPISGTNYLSGNMFLSQPSGTNPLTWSTKPLSLVPPIYGYNDNSLVNYPSQHFAGGATPPNTLTATAVRYGGCASDTQLPVACQQSSVNIGIIATGTNSAVAFKDHLPFGNIVKDCEYRYRMGFRNTGATPINTFTIEDDLPSAFTPTGVIGLYYPYNISSSNFMINVNGSSVSYTVTGSMPYFVITLNSGAINTGDILTFKVSGVPTTIDLETNQSCFIDIIGSHNSGSCFNNIATVTIPNLSPLTDADLVCPATPSTRVCYRKEVLNPNNLPTIYQRGNTVKYRVRVKNTGNTTFTPTIVDELGSGLEYDNTILDAKLYRSDANVTGPPTVAYQGVATQSYSAGNITFTFPSLTGACATTDITTCDSNYAKKDHYYVEFNLKVSANSPAGDVPNVIYESTTPTVKNTAYISVGHAYGLNVVKRVRKKGTTTWSSSVDALAGDKVEFQLDFHNTSTVTLNDLLLIDLLPRVTDRAVLVGNIRNSQFALIDPSAFNATKKIGSAVPSTYSIPFGALTLSANLNPKLTDFGQSVGTPVVWNNSPSSNNIRLELIGGNVLQPDEHLLLQFETQVPLTATVDKIACNSFAAKATTFNGSGVGVTILPIESNTVCVKVIPVPDTCSCKDITFSVTNDPAKLCEDKVSYKTKCKVKKIEIQSAGNSVQFTTLPIGCTPVSNTATIIDFGVSGCSTSPYQFNLLSTNGVQPYTVVVTLSNGTTCVLNDKLGCPKKDTCLTINYTLNCNLVPLPNTGPYFYTITITNPNSTNIAVPMTSNTGLISPSSINAMPGTNTYTVYYTPNPNTTKACILFGTGIVATPICNKPEECVLLPICQNCCDDVKVDKQIKNCCSLLKFGNCKMKNISINVTNGVIASLDYGNSTCTDPTANNTNTQTISSCTLPQSLQVCVKNTSNQSVLYVSYDILFENGEKCNKKDTIKCPPPVVGNCCPKTTMVACCINSNEIKYTFSAAAIPTDVCGIIINTSNSLGLSAGNVYSGGIVAYAVSVSLVGSTTNLNPTAQNGSTIDFSITAPLLNPTVNVTIKYVLCDGTVCDPENFTLGSPSVMNGNKLISQTISDSLFAASYKLDFAGVKDSKLKIKSISILPQGTKATDIFFAITGSSVLGSESKLLLSLDKSLQGGSFATFVLKNAVSVNEYKGEVLNIVTRGRVSSFKVFMFDEKGGLISESTINSKLETVTSSKELKSNLTSLSVAPNPASDDVNLSFVFGATQTVKIDLLDISGKFVKSIDKTICEENKVKTISFNTNDLQSGLYIIRLTNEKGQSFVEKLSVVH